MKDKKQILSPGSLASLGPSELEGLDEEQFEQMMMEDEEYGRRQLELAAIEIAKKKKKEEREAKKLEKARQKALEILAAERQESMNLDGTDGEIPKKKKRGRRSKAEILAEQMRRDASGVPPELLQPSNLVAGPPPQPGPGPEVLAASIPSLPVVPMMEPCEQRMLESPMMPMMTSQVGDYEVCYTFIYHQRLCVPPLVQAIYWRSQYQPTRYFSYFFVLTQLYDCYFKYFTKLRLLLFLTPLAIFTMSYSSRVNGAGQFLIISFINITCHVRALIFENTFIARRHVLTALRKWN
jgi:hypothetical protein